MEEEVKSASVKTSEEIDEKPWVFLEKELQEFERVMKQLEEGQLSIKMIYIYIYIYIFLKRILIFQTFQK